MIDTDKAYLLGLIIGGGVFGNDENSFTIRLPYKKWGSYYANPQRAGNIARDILGKVGQMFRAVYGLPIQYEATPGGIWTILFQGDISVIKDELEHYGIICEGELRGNVDLSKMVLELIDDNLKRRFIAGLADTIGSMAKSQRRFSNENQIISFEIKGYNFKFVCDLCRLLYSINCIPDQINWNHPNIHCARDSYYKQWNKGFKLRILLDQYAKFGAFAFRTKAETSNENRRLQRETHYAEKCETREMNFTPSTVHPAEFDNRLPENIRGGHYIHFRHFCAVMGCEHAPYCKIREQFDKIGDLINPFPILHKDTEQNLNEVIQSNLLYSKRNYSNIEIKLKLLLDMYNEDRTALLYGVSCDSGYPISEILQASAYIVANNDELSGKRPKNGYITIIEKHLQDDSDLSIKLKKPDLLTPLIIIGNGRGAMIGARNPVVYRKLVSVSPENEYKLLIRDITEDDLKNAR